MPTLVLGNVPDDLYKSLKEIAADQQPFMTQEAILSLRTALEGIEEPPARPGLDGDSRFVAA